jgi:cytidylate kinase
MVGDAPDSFAKRSGSCGNLAGEPGREAAQKARRNREHLAMQTVGIRCPSVVVGGRQEKVLPVARATGRRVRRYHGSGGSLQPTGSNGDGAQPVREAAMDRPTTTVLTISRQFASGGSFIGQKVAQRLGLRYTDREILAHAAKESGIDEANLVLTEERAGGFWTIAFRQFAMGTAEAPYIAPPPPTLPEADLFSLESRFIREIAGRFDAVIVGRAGFHVLADHPGLVSVRIHAPLEWRVLRAMAVYGLESEGVARDAIGRSDLQRAKFVRKFTGREWNDATAHHLCLDTGALGLDLAVELVTKLVGDRITSRQSTAPVLA